MNVSAGVHSDNSNRKFIKLAALVIRNKNKNLFAAIAFNQRPTRFKCEILNCFLYVFNLKNFVPTMVLRERSDLVSVHFTNQPSLH